MKQIYRNLQKLFGRSGKARLRKDLLWPGESKVPRVDYETNSEFHDTYNHGLTMTQMEYSNNPMRRQRFYTFRYLLQGVTDVAGDVCEVGCYRGLSAYLIAEILTNMGKKVDFHICDSFEGLSNFDDSDKSTYRNMNTPERLKHFVCPLDTVKYNLREYDFINYHKGWIPEPFKNLTEKTFCFVHIDVDLYMPTLDSFKFFYPRLNRQGIMVFDDYGSLNFPGSRKAIDECLSEIDDVCFVAVPSGQAFLIKR